MGFLSPSPGDDDHAGLAGLRSNGRPRRVSGAGFGSFPSCLCGNPRGPAPGRACPPPPTPVLASGALGWSLLCRPGPHAPLQGGCLLLRKRPVRGRGFLRRRRSGFGKSGFGRVENIHSFTHSLIRLLVPQTAVCPRARLVWREGPQWASPVFGECPPGPGTHARETDGSTQLHFREGTVVQQGSTRSGQRGRGGRAGPEFWWRRRPCPGPGRAALGERGCVARVGEARVGRSRSLPAAQAT